MMMMRETLRMRDTRMRPRKAAGNLTRTSCNRRRAVKRRADSGGETRSTSTSGSGASTGGGRGSDGGGGRGGRDELTTAASRVATTFAPRSSEVGSAAKPASKGSVLYTIFEVQAGVSAVVGGLLAFNVIFPTDEPSIARLLGMWSCWIFTVPSLRARQCGPREKDALNLLFLLIPLINVGMPFVWKSFAAVYSADILALLGVYAWKLEWLSDASAPAPPSASDDSTAE